MSKKPKGAWDNCATSHHSYPDRFSLVLNTIAKNRGIPKAKVIELLLLESITFNMTQDAISKSGVFDEMDSAYEEVKKKMKIMKSVK